MDPSKLSLKPYDDAILNYFTTLFGNTYSAPTDKAYAENAKRNKDKVLLPMLSVWRNPSTVFNGVGNFGSFKRGHVINRSSDSLDITKLRLLPITLEYQVDVWGQSVDVATKLFSETLFYLNDNPTIHIPVDFMTEPLGVCVTVTDVTDLTDLNEEEDQGRLGRWAIVFTIDAHLLKPIVGNQVVSLPIEMAVEEFDSEQFT